MGSCNASRNKHCTKKFSIKDFYSKHYQIRKKMRILSHLLIKTANGKLYFLCSESVLQLMKKSCCFNGLT